MRGLSRPSLIASLLGMLLSIWQPQQLSAQAPAACADGYVLWANRQLAAETLPISGSTSRFAGGIHSNADLRISGSNHQITGPVRFVSSFADAGDANQYAPPSQVAATPPPVAYTLADYQPGGAIAAAAEADGRYTVIRGDLDVAEPRALSGLYYVTGSVKLSASGISGAVTIVAEGTIDVSGSSQRLSPYADGLLLYAAQSGAAPAITIAGSGSALAGVIAAPSGLVELSGGQNTLAGMVVGGALQISGSTLSLTFAGEHCPGRAGAPASDPYAPGELVVKLFSAADLAAVAQDHGLSPTPLSQFGARPIFRLQITDGADPAAKAEQIRLTDGRVEFAEPNYQTQTPEARRGRTSWVVGGGAAGYAQQWAPAAIRLPEAHSVSQGAGVTVAVLDTGVEPSHPALAGRLTPGYDFVDDDADPREEGAPGQGGYGHGTHVAGLIALTAPGAQIMPVRVLDRDGAGNIWVLSEGLLYAAERGPDGQPSSGDEAQVINLSLGTLRRTQLLEGLIRELTCDDDDDDDDGACAVSGGVVVVAAAGNGGDTLPNYPAAEGVAGAIAIGASTPGDELASFSTRGPWVPLMAPGEAIISTVPGGGYGSWSGTSMAAPIAAGTAALVRAAMPGLTAVEVTTRLVDTGAPTGGPVARRLDAAAALGLGPRPRGAFAAFLPELTRAGAAAQ